MKFIYTNPKLTYTQLEIVCYVLQSINSGPFKMPSRLALPHATSNRCLSLTHTHFLPSSSSRAHPSSACVLENLNLLPSQSMPSAHTGRGWTDEIFDAIISANGFGEGDS